MCVFLIDLFLLLAYFSNSLLNNPAHNDVLYISCFQDLSLLILATDMSRHAEILQEFKERSIKFDSTSSKDLTSLKLILIKVKKNCEIKTIVDRYIYIFLKIVKS